MRGDLQEFSLPLSAQLLAWWGKAFNQANRRPDDLHYIRSARIRALFVSLGKSSGHCTDTTIDWHRPVALSTDGKINLSRVLRDSAN